MARPEGWLVAAQIGRARGLRGEVHLIMRTDRVAERFAIGSSFPTDPPGNGPLTLASLTPAQGSYLARFDGVGDREQAEALRGTELLVEPDAEDDAWYPGELEGLRATLVTGEELGTVAAVEFGSAQDLLVLVLPGGGTVRIPFTEAFVPHVDIAAGVVRVDPPDGLIGEAGDGA